MKTQHSKEGSKSNQISVNVTSGDDGLFEIICSDSKSPEKCQVFVDRLQEASNNIRSKS